MNDPSGLAPRLLVMALALAASFFFSASEFAVIRLDRLKVRQAADEGSRSDRILAGFLSDTGRFLSGISIGNTLANLLLSSFAAITFAPPLARAIASSVRADAATENAAAAIVTVLLSVAVLVFGEVAPKQAAIAAGERFAHRVVPGDGLAAFEIHHMVAELGFNNTHVAFLALAVHLGAGRGKREFNDNDLRLQLDDDIAATLEGMHFGIGNDADAAQQH